MLKEIRICKSWEGFTKRSKFGRWSSQNRWQYFWHS